MTHLRQNLTSLLSAADDSNFQLTHPGAGLDYCRRYSSAQQSRKQVVRLQGDCARAADCSNFRLTHPGASPDYCRWYSSAQQSRKQRCLERRILHLLRQYSDGEINLCQLLNRLSLTIVLRLVSSSQCCVVVNHYSRHIYGFNFFLFGWVYNIISIIKQVISMAKMLWFI